MSDSDLAVYDTDANQVSTTHDIADPDRRETWPSWSADGRTLYFCSAPQLPMTQLHEVKYDLMRISYDAATGTWGKRETVLSAADSGMSAAQPKESPDGRWLLFSLAHHGNFPIFQPTCRSVRHRPEERGAKALDCREQQVERFVALLVEQWEMDCFCQQTRGGRPGADLFQLF